MERTIGHIAEFEKTFSPEDVALFSSISNDNNPIHLDAEYAEKSIFGRRVVHGLLVSSLFSKIFGTIYPGSGSIYLTQNVKFLKPAFVGENLKAVITLIEFDEIKNRGNFITEVFNMSDQKLITGEAIILFPNVEI
ncbi:MAG: MaoC family dehydratase [Saprospiraceae bacterium]|nr:MaoC family dehydratase [Candidatus Brachybacter algidus]MBL0120507.1 MaoC family dehydratase [Candidatus Brachybacter algidus]MBP7306768.1 MaoC family dehydratase [Saprospiraceae bacterium]HQW70946.1 MaoC family dehydratase [Saprospiraceae bacterium]